MFSSGMHRAVDARGRQSRRQASMAHTSQSRRPDSGLVVQVKVLETIQVVPSWFERDRSPIPKPWCVWCMACFVFQPPNSGLWVLRLGGLWGLGRGGFRLQNAPYCRCPRQSSVRLQIAPGMEIGISLRNNQRQYRTLHVQKDVLPYALCWLLCPVSTALASIKRVRSQAFSPTHVFGPGLAGRVVGTRIDHFAFAFD